GARIVGCFRREVGRSMSNVGAPGTGTEQGWGGGMATARPRSMFSEYAQNAGDIAARQREIGLKLRENIVGVIDGMNRAIEDAIDELDQGFLRPPLHASVANNVEVIVTMLIEQRDVTELPPVPA